MSNIPYTYIPNIFSHLSFEQIDDSIKWEQRNAPRAESYYAMENVPYTYGKGEGERTYWPCIYSVMPTILWSIIYSIGPILLRTYSKTGLDLLFCNRYADQHQHLGWHADDGKLIDPAQPITVVTFGAEREIWFKSKQTYEGDPIYGDKITLGHGSVLIMPPGFQQNYLHRIPKHSRPCEPRISLTFRGLKA